MSDGHQPKCKPGTVPEEYCPNPEGSSAAPPRVDLMWGDIVRLNEIAIKIQRDMVCIDGRIRALEDEKAAPELQRLRTMETEISVLVAESSNSDIGSEYLLECMESMLKGGPHERDS